MTASTRVSIGALGCVLGALGWFFGLAVIERELVELDHWNYHGVMALTGVAWVFGLLGLHAAHGRSSRALRLAIFGKGLFTAAQAAEFVLRDHSLPLPPIFILGLALYGVGMVLFAVGALRREGPRPGSTLPLAMGVLGILLFPAMIAMGSLPAGGLAVLLANGICWLLLGYLLWRQAVPGPAIEPVQSP